MASVQNAAAADVHLLKRTRISVYVDEALPDILVVTYKFGVKIFKGVLLDSTKKNLPCGVQTLNPAFAPPPPATTTTTPSSAGQKDDSDPLYAASQRFAYGEPAGAQKKRTTQISKYKTNKMTVRLRPRQVLCSKCKGICNENSENVTRKRKPAAAEAAAAPAPAAKRGANAPVTRSVHKTVVGNTVVTTTTRELPNPDKKSSEESTALADPSEEPSSQANKDSEPTTTTTTTTTSAAAAMGKRTLRKKRSVGSSEDNPDETPAAPGPTTDGGQAKERVAGGGDQPLTATCTNTTRTIKISYGPQGEGTVLKIPAQIENLTLSDHDSEENLDEQRLLKLKDENNRDKAARRAMKRAKRREAKKKVLLLNHHHHHQHHQQQHQSPPPPTPYSVGASSPRYTVGSASPRHGLGNASPRYAAAACDPCVPRKRKHKVKHKKKHKEDRRHRDSSETALPPAQEEAPATGATGAPPPPLAPPPREHAVTQKLSINLKRLNNTYTSSCSSSVENEDSGSEDAAGGGDRVPDFPPLDAPLALRLNAPALASAPGANGCKLLVGDVVWGKIHGFPWWPGKILTITNGENKIPQAHVSWYGSPTSSLIQCDQLSLYLENFKVRYNKKKRGPYKEAVKRATNDARENAEARVREPPVVAAGSPARPFMNVVPPALASPREIDVVS